MPQPAAAPPPVPPALEGEADLFSTLLDLPPIESRALVDRVGGLRGLLGEPPEALERASGLSPARARRLAAALALAGRAAGLSGPRPRLLRDPDALFAAVGPALALAPVEELHVVYLDARMQLIELRRMFVGSDMCVVVEPREVMRVALLLRSRHLALAHNHPSGDPEPSAQDLALTRRLAELCGLMGIDLVDHLVIGRPGWVSMRRDGHYQPRAGANPAFVW